jgi:hypothetical protein
VPTVQLLIVCATVLAGLLIALRACERAFAARVRIARLERQDRAQEREEARRQAELDVDPASRPGPSLVGETVVIQIRGEEHSVRGVVHGDHADRIVLRDAVYLHAGGQQSPAGGVVSVLRAAISSLQEIAPQAEAP